MGQADTWLRVFRRLGLAQRQPDLLRLTTDIEGMQAWLDIHRPDALAPRDVQTKERSEDSCREAQLGTPEITRPGHEGFPPPPSWFVACDSFLNKARNAVVCRDAASGYEYLHIAEREAVPGLSAEQRRVRAQSLLAEMEQKFKGTWRAHAMGALLIANDGCVSAESLAEAIGHRNTSDQNARRKMDKIRWQLAWLSLILGGLVFIAAAIAIWLPPDMPSKTGLLPYCIFLGLLGGFMSSAMSARATDRQSSVPDIEVQFYARIARGLLGSAMSIPAYFLGKSGLVNIGGPSSFRVESNTQNSWS